MNTSIQETNARIIATLSGELDSAAAPKTEEARIISGGIDRMPDCIHRHDCVLRIFHPCYRIPRDAQQFCIQVILISITEEYSIFFMVNQIGCRADMLRGQDAASRAHRLTYDNPPAFL